MSRARSPRYTLFFFPHVEYLATAYIGPSAVATSVSGTLLILALDQADAQRCFDAPLSSEYHDASLRPRLQRQEWQDVLRFKLKRQRGLHAHLWKFPLVNTILATLLTQQDVAPLQANTAFDSLVAIVAFNLSLHFRPPPAA